VASWSWCLSITYCTCRLLAEICYMSLSWHETDFCKNFIYNCTPLCKTLIHTAYLENFFVLFEMNSYFFFAYGHKDWKILRQKFWYSQRLLHANSSSLKWFLITTSDFNCPLYCVYMYKQSEISSWNYGFSWYKVKQPLCIKYLQIALNTTRLEKFSQMFGNINMWSLYFT